MKRFLLFVVFALVSLTRITAQDKLSDSIRLALSTLPEDTTKVKELNKTATSLKNSGMYKKALSFGLEAEKLSGKLNYKKGLGQSMNIIGALYRSMGDFDHAFQYLKSALRIKEETGEKNGAANVLNNIGLIYYSQGDLPRALDYYFKSLSLRQETKDNEGIGSQYNNIGSTYWELGDSEKALEYDFKALACFETCNYKRGLAAVLGNIAEVYSMQHNPGEAMPYLNRALLIRQEMHEKKGTASILSQIGTLNLNQGKYPEALAYYEQAHTLRKEMEDKPGIGWSLRDIATANLKMGKTDKALEYCLKSLAIAREIGALADIKDNEESLTEMYEKKHDAAQALLHYKAFIASKDSLFSQETTRKSVRAEMNFEFNKKQTADSIQNVETQKTKDAQIKTQHAQLKQEETQRYALYGGLALIAVFASVMYQRFRVTKKQKAIIEEQKEILGKQKELVESQKEVVFEKNREITDSITYAKRLQDAILPPVKTFRSVFPDSFLLYKPKDIVAGDFYWLEKVKDEGEEVILVAAADCTGHGVPGALVSIVCSNALHRAVNEFGITEPGKILDKVRDLVLETFAKSESEVKDGMDISLASINLHTRTLKWAGANNPLWYLQNKTLQTITANKQPVGKTEKPLPFTTHTLALNKGDSFLLFTDGYADQFGGPKGKKFKYKNLQEILISSAGSPQEQLFQKLETIFDDWKGGLEQVDDVCVMGIGV
jgi:serine phosphatase RsbU (regulator of sigma subunit)